MLLFFIHLCPAYGNRATVVGPKYAVGIPFTWGAIEGGIRGTLVHYSQFLSIVKVGQ